MALRSGHGKGQGTPRIEVLPVDELPPGLQATMQPKCDSEYGARGLLPGAQVVPSMGGKAKRDKVRLSSRLGLAEHFADPKFEPYAKAAGAFRRLHTRMLAQGVGGGFCGPAPSSMVASAALQLAASRYAFEVLGDMALGSKLANDSRQNLLAAHELCAREAAASQARKRPAWMDLGEDGKG